jgi:hypothetical protein
MRANATVIEIIIAEDKNIDLYSITIQDNGEGMNEDIYQKATEPFFTSRKTRKVGLGLALLKQNAERTGGSLRLESQPGKGTNVIVYFKPSHIDHLPLGDFAEILVLMMIGNVNLTFKYTHKTLNGTFQISSSELKKELEGVSLKNREVRNAVIELINNNLDEIEATR